MSSRIVFFLLKLKNAAIYKKEIIEVEYKQDYLPILELLYSEGYIQTFSVIKNNKTGNSHIKIFLRYIFNIFALNNLKLLSKQSCIRTITYKQLACNVYDIRKTFFITTNKGIKTHTSCKNLKLGGNLFFMC